MRGAARQRAPRRARPARRFPSSRSTCWRSRSSPRSRRSEWDEDELFALIRRAWPYRALAARGFRRGAWRCWPRASATRRGRRGALIHHDAVNRVLRGRRGARLTALTSGGAIPDTADYQVVLEPENQIVGTVNEDFAVESMAGDIFQLGNTSYRILRVERGTVRVEDAQGMPPTIPFWLGEAPGRTDELSQAVSRLRGEIRRAAADAGGASTRSLAGRRGRASPSRAAEQLVDYLARGHAALGVAADPRDARARALLRRGRRHAARHPLALRQPHQPRLGPGAAQALLPHVQLRAAGGGDRGRHRAVADDQRTASRSPTSRVTCIRPASRATC